MIYHINQNGDIVAISQENINQNYQRFGADITNVQADLITQPQNYRYVNSEFVLRDDVPFTIQKQTIIVDEILNITVPENTTVQINGPGFFVADNVEDGVIEFASERAGVYTFTLTKYPYKETKFNIEVIV